MRLLASVKVRLFLASWLVFSLFFATNVVREHYPAFTLIERGDFICDEYQDWHADIFRHTDGHSYVGNNVLGSLIAAAPLAVFDPLLDRIEAYSKRTLAESPEPADTNFESKHPNRVHLFRLAKLAGKDLRLGASAAITSVFLMAPLSALYTVLVCSFLLARGVARSRAVWLGFLFAFGTPIAYRTAHLNHNMFLMQALFGAFLLLYVQPGEPFRPSPARRAWAGFLLGCSIALDYAGIFPAVVIGLYYLWNRKGATGWGRALGESVPGLLAALPPIFFLVWSQKVMYGGWFTPGQVVMRPVNYTEVGYKGLDWPSLEVLFKNFVMPGWGLYSFGPLLLLGLVPSRVWRGGDLVLPVRERRWVLALVVIFLLFNASNVYSLMQFNSGFRYLLPLVPFLFLQASDALVRMSRRSLASVSAVVLGHSLVLCMAREVNDTEKHLRDAAVAQGISEVELPGYWKTMLTETPIPMSYRRVFYAATELDWQGPQLPWLTTLAQSKPKGHWIRSPALPLALMGVCGLVVLALWRIGARGSRATLPPASSVSARDLRAA